MDSIMYANDMNINNHLCSHAQFSYYINTIRKMKRKHTWIKKQDDETLSLIQDCFKVNINKAKEIYKILNDEDIVKIKKSMIKGGNNNKKRG